MIAAPVMSHSMSEQGGGNISCFYYNKSRITFTCRINTTANHARKDTNVLTWRSYFFLWYYEMIKRLMWGAADICDAKATLLSINWLVCYLSVSINSHCDEILSLRSRPNKSDICWRQPTSSITGDHFWRLRDDHWEHLNEMALSLGSNLESLLESTTCVNGRGRY